ncbi:MAG TPA: tyrosine-type recombinase/integrase [Pseudonocardiaceae bacterium]
MTALAPTLQAFFTDRLARQRHASPHTIAAYRDTWRLLLGFTSAKTGKQPSQLEITDLNAPLIGAFLDHLEQHRNNSPRTRNARLAAIHSLFRYAALHHPEHADLIARVLAIPPKRTNKALVTYLTEPELAALLTAPNRSTWAGRRDHALILLAAQTGLRLSELTGLTLSDTHLATGAHVSCHGKGRKDRITPLTTTTITVLRTWLAEHTGQPSQPLFPTRNGGRLSRDAVERRIAKHTATAALRCPSLNTKTITAHTLRHTAAMRLLHAGTDTSVIALWLGHEQADTTQIYLHADLALKEQALARTKPLNTTPGRYRPPDTLLAFLEAL